MKRYSIRVRITDGNYSFIARGLLKRNRWFEWLPDERVAHFREELKPGNLDALCYQLTMRYNWLDGEVVQFLQLPDEEETP